MTGNMTTWTGLVAKLGIGLVCLAGLVWGAFSLGSRRERPQADAHTSGDQSRDMPAIDAAAPADYATATFALG